MACSTCSVSVPGAVGTRALTTSSASHTCPREASELIEEFDEGVEARAGVGRYAEHRRAGVLRLKQVRQFGRFSGRKLVDAIDDDQVGLFKLLLEDVGRLRRKAALGISAQDAAA